MKDRLCPVAGGAALPIGAMLRRQMLSAPPLFSASMPLRPRCRRLRSYGAGDPPPRWKLKMTGPEAEATPLDMSRLEAHVHAVLSAGLLPADLNRNLHAPRHSDDHLAFCGLIEALRSEPLLEVLDGKIMNAGRGGSVFNLRKVAFWLVRQSLTAGVHGALATLSAWVVQDYNDGFDVVLLSGVAIREPLSLPGGISLIPIDALPHRLLGYSWSEFQDARSKLADLVSFNTPFTYTFHCLLPSAALVRPMKFRPRVWDRGKRPKIMSDSPSLIDLCWCFAALEPCWPQPHAFRTVLADSVPAADLPGASHQEPGPHYALGECPSPPSGGRSRPRAAHISALQCFARQTARAVIAGVRMAEHGEATLAERSKDR
jgi:hypothetical protein